MRGRVIQGLPGREVGVRLTRRPNRVHRELLTAALWWRVCRYELALDRELTAQQAPHLADVDGERRAAGAARRRKETPEERTAGTKDRREHLDVLRASRGIDR